MSDDSCVFCQIVKGKIPAKPVFETDTVFAFADLNPQAPTHILAIHKRHSAQFSQSDDALLSELFSGVRALAEKLELKDYRLVINNGEQAGQTVFHLHVHVLSGRAFQWPPG
jgi:histidine triad (HIT) family protein